MWRYSLFGSSRKRAQAKELEHQVTALKAALSACKGMARRWTAARRGLTVALAFAMLVLGFLLGTYREPLQDALANIGLRTVAAWSTPDIDAAYAAYRKNDYSGALKLARPLAGQGDARAQALLGLVYSTNARGIPRDDLQAAQWFRRAADQGDASAQFNLGVMYAEGKGVAQDFGEAVKWYQLAADQGYPQAQFNLGLWYATDEGALDRVSAYKWLNLAAARFETGDDRRRRNAAVQNRDLVAAKMTPEQLAEAQRLTREWRPVGSGDRERQARAGD